MWNVGQTCLRAARVADDYQDYYYLLTSVRRNSRNIASQLVALVLRSLPLPERLLLVIDDSPTKRYGPHGRASASADFRPQEILASPYLENAR